MRCFGKLIACATVSASLIVSSTAAVAQAAPAPASQIDSWAALSVLSGGAPAAALCGAAAAAAAAQPAGGCVFPQTGVVPVVPQQVQVLTPAAYTGIGTPPIPVMLIWLAVLGTMVYIATKNNHNQVPNSPA